MSAGLVQVGVLAGAGCVDRVAARHGVAGQGGVVARAEAGGHSGHRVVGADELGAAGQGGLAARGALAVAGALIAADRAATAAAVATVAARRLRRRSIRLVPKFTLETG